MSRRGRTSRHQDAEATRPRVPIIPMLDMAFQLLAFGLTMFDLAPTMEEGQYTMALPSSGMSTPLDPTKPDDKPPEKFTLAVTADSVGRVRNVSLTHDELIAAALPRDLKELTETLATRLKASTGKTGKAPTIEIQFDPELNYQVAFEVFGAVATAGFERVTPNILGADAEPMPPMP